MNSGSTRADNYREEFLEQVRRIADALEELVQLRHSDRRREHDYRKTYLDARFPYGKPRDRWSSRTS